jgi:hypothetical protein
MSHYIAFWLKLDEVNFGRFLLDFNIINAHIESVEWTVKRRYKEFADLHETLLDAGVQRESLPEKK